MPSVADVFEPDRLQPIEMSFLGRIYDVGFKCLSIIPGAVKTKTVVIEWGHQATSFRPRERRSMSLKSSPGFGGSDRRTVRPAFSQTRAASRAFSNPTWSWSAMTVTSEIDVRDAK